MKLAFSLAACQAADLQAEVSADAVVGVTVGNFDGMHLGHQVLFRRLHEQLSDLARSEQKRACAVLLTFAPHPRHVFRRKSLGHSVLPAEDWLTLTSPRQKVDAARQNKFDLMIVQRFVPSFYQISPAEFIERYLVATLHARVVVVGQDWSFGKGRAGTAATLIEAGQRLGFSTDVVSDVAHEGVRVSSSAVRTALLTGDLGWAETLLGRPYEVIGRVRHGDKRGRTLGFPTANLKISKHVLPPNGVYAVWAEVNGKSFGAVASLGVRPVFESAGERLLEVHLISSEQLDIYGELLKVRFIKLLRPELAFSSVDELVRAMKQDLANARAALGIP